MQTKVERAMAAANVPWLNFEFPKATPLMIHLIDIVDRNVAEKYYISDERLKGLVSFDSPQGIYDGIVRVGTLATMNGHDYIKRVYGTNGIAPALPTGSGGGHLPKIEVGQ